MDAGFQNAVSGGDTVEQRRSIIFECHKKLLFVVFYHTSALDFMQKDIIV
jgi:hypothetical protein